MSFEPVSFPLTGHMTPEEIEEKWEELTPQQQLEYLDLDDSLSLEQLDEDIAKAKEGQGPRVIDPKLAEMVAFSMKPLIDAAVTAEREFESLRDKDDADSVALRIVAADRAYQFYMAADMEAQNPGSIVMGDD
jgi:hypothetical protein